MASAPRRVSQQTRLVNLLCLFVECPKGEFHIPPGFLLWYSLWRNATLQRQPGGPHLVYVQPQCQTGIGEGAATRSILLIPSGSVSTQVLDGRFVFGNESPLESASTRGLTKRRPSIFCLLYHIVAPHRIVNEISCRLASVHHHFAIVRTHPIWSSEPSVSIPYCVVARRSVKIW